VAASLGRKQDTGRSKLGISYVCFVKQRPSLRGVEQLSQLRDPARQIDIAQQRIAIEGVIGKASLKHVDILQPSFSVSCSHLRNGFLTGNRIQQDWEWWLGVVVMRGRC